MKLKKNIKLDMRKLIILNQKKFFFLTLLLLFFQTIHFFFLPFLFLVKVVNPNCCFF